jgi:hypothetical protein
MFERIKRQWREARGEGLRREFEDAILRLNGLGPEVNARASLTLAKSLRELEANHGPLANISNDGKVRLAKQLRQFAKQKFTFDMGTGYGLALLSMYVESQAVPGPHGRFVESASQDFVSAARQVEQSMAGATSDEVGDQPATNRVPSSDSAAADRDNPISRVAEHLRIMGYDLTPYGAGVALLEIESGYSEAETASHIAHTTLALDVKEAGTDIEKLLGFLPHGMALLEVLKDYKDRGMMRESQWQNDSTAVFRVITVDEHQEEWIAKILSDPIAGKQRLATSRVA